MVVRSTLTVSRSDFAMKGLLPLNPSWSYQHNETFFRCTAKKSSTCQPVELEEPATLRTMIEHIHNNPLGRGLVNRRADWPWSNARYYEGMPNALLRMDPLPVLNG